MGDEARPFSPADIPGLVVWEETDDDGNLVDRLHPGRIPSPCNVGGYCEVKSRAIYDRPLTEAECHKVGSYLSDRAGKVTC